MRRRKGHRFKRRERLQGHFSLPSKIFGEQVASGVCLQVRFPTERPETFRVDQLTDAGNGLNVVKVMPESAIKFGAYEVSKSIRCLLALLLTIKASKRAFARLEGHNDTKKLLPTSQFLSGGLGGMVAQYVAMFLNLTGTGADVHEVFRLPDRHP